VLQKKLSHAELKFCNCFKRSLPGKPWGPSSGQCGCFLTVRAENQNSEGNGPARAVPVSPGPPTTGAAVASAGGPGACFGAQRRRTRERSSTSTCQPCGASCRKPDPLFTLLYSFWQFAGWRQITKDKGRESQVPFLRASCWGGEQKREMRT